jgi:hypothetical protein
MPVVATAGLQFSELEPCAFQAQIPWSVAAPRLGERLTLIVGHIRLEHQATAQIELVMADKAGQVQ